MMNSFNLLKKISYYGMIISGIGLLLNILSVFVSPKNLNGSNFRYGFQVPVNMSVWINFPNEADSLSVNLMTAKPFTLTALGCPNATKDIISVQDNESSIYAQNRLSLIKTELKIKSNNLIVNILLFIFNLLPSLFWLGLLYLTTSMTRINPSGSNVNIQYSSNLNTIGRLICYYELLLLLFSLANLLIFGGAAYVSDSSIINDYYRIHFHPRIIFNFPELLIGIGLIWISTIIKNLNNKDVKA